MLRACPRIFVSLGFFAILCGTVATACAEDELEALGKAVQGKDAKAEFAPQRQLPAFADRVTSLAFSPDGQTLAVGGKNVVQLVPTSGTGTATDLPVTVGQVRSLAYSPNGELLAVGGYQQLKLIKLSDRSIVRELKGHRGIVTAVAFSPDGTTLASASDDTTARFWTVATGDAVVLTGHEYPVSGLAWSADGTFLATAAGDDTRSTKGGEVALWDRAGQRLHQWTDHKKAAICVAISRDGKHLISGGLDERAIVYDFGTKKALGFYAGHQRPVNAIQLLANGDTVVSIGGGRNQGGNLLKVWNREDGSDFATGEVHEEKILALAVSADGKLAATGGQDKLVCLWNLAQATSKPDVVAAVVNAVTQAVQTKPATDKPATEKPAETKPAEAKPAETKVIRIGVIGLDTSHAPAFAKLMNDPKATEDIAGVKVVAAYPKGSPDIESSTTRVPGYTEEYKKMGIEIVDSIPALLELVDAVLLETNDGRPHLEQVLPVLKAVKPCFIDKPIAGSLSDAIAIFEASKHYKTPIFSSSSLRYTPGALEARSGKYGTVFGCETYSPCSLEKTHPDLFWYGIHGVESLFTTMGTGCETVARTHTPGLDVCVGVWANGRVGTFRGIRQGSAGYGGKAYTEKGIHELGSYAGYRPLAVEIVKFFKTKEPPVSEAETLEIYAFMEAADESKRQGGVPIKLADVMAKAKPLAEAALKDRLK